MRRLLFCACGLLALVSVARGQATWNFTAGTGAPASLSANITGGTITATNGSLVFAATSVSSGYTGASGGVNASVGAVPGNISTTTSGYFEFTLSATSGNRLFAHSLSFGTRSTSTGPTVVALYSSSNGFAAPIGSTTVNPDGNWALVTFSSLSLFSATNGSVTFRIYGGGGSSASAGNWRVDDLALGVSSSSPGPAIITQPASQNVPPGATASLSVAAAGTGTVTYQWRKGGVALNPTIYPSAATATLNLGIVSSTDSGSYDDVITDSTSSTTSSVATLVVAITPATVTLGALAATFDGTPHAVTATTSPASLGVAITYNGQTNSPPTNAGSYAIAATITDPAFIGSASGTLVISPAPQTISFSTNPGFVPQVGTPFTVSASASGGTTVRFSVFSGNAAASGTNNSTITLNSTALATIRATTSGDANNATVTTAPATASPDLSIAAASPIAITGTYTQAFDTLGTAIPAGWHVFTGATASAIGTDISGVASSLLLAATDWGSATGNFRNVASALNGGVNPADSPTVQSAYANRALGVRQNAGLDPGAAFGFNFATTGINVASISFSAQIVSTQPNATTWLLQSGVGPNPTTWTTLATCNDPGVFGATPISVTPSVFGTSLNNQGSVWLRVVALGATTFGGTRDTFAIDNFSIVTGPPASVTTQPVALTRTSGQSATFSASATGTGALSYQWRKGTTTIGGATNSTFTIPSVVTADAGDYNVVVTDTVAGVIVGTATSATAALIVNPIATMIALSNLTASYDGNPHAATATPTPSGATVTLTYSGIGATPYTASTTPPSAAGRYLVSATATDSEHRGAASNILVIGGALDSVAPTVVTAPTAQSVVVGTLVGFSVEVTGSPSPALQWRKDGVAIAGAVNSTYTIFGAALTDAGVYDAVAANPGGTIVSPGAALTVTKREQTITFAAPTTTFTGGAAVKLTATASSGLPVSFTIVSGAGSISGSTLTGLGTTVVVRASQAGNAAMFNAAENVDRTFSFVSGGTAPFLFSSPADQTVSAGANVTFAAAAIGTPAPTWQWQKDDVAIAGATNATLALADVTIADAGRYTVIATNSVGSASASATLTVRAAPAFTVSPASQNAAGGANVTFAASVTGSPTPALQWRRNGIAIPGAVSNTLSLVNVRAADTGRYDVVATSILGRAISSAATLTVTLRDFSGSYFGEFAGAIGDFALYVRADGTAVFLGYLPGSKTGFVATDVAVDLSGNFSLNFATTSAASSGSPLSELGADSITSPTAAAAQSVTLRGTLNDATGALAATVAELSLTLDGARAGATGAATAQAGYYSGAFVGSAAGRGYVIVAPDGQAFALAANGAIIDGAKGTVGANGRLVLTTPEQTTLDLGFANGAIAGTVVTAAGVVGSLTGAVDALAGTERLANISVRGGIAPGAPLIAGFVVTGDTPKQILIRAAGPALVPAPFNVTNALDDPALSLFRGNIVIAQNDNWSMPPASAAAITAAATSVNAFAFRAGSADAALLIALAPGPYTVQVAPGAAARDATGVALVEIYEILAPGEAAGARRLANLSARGPVAPAAPLIAGFVINGTAPQRVLIRGIGPTLDAFGVTGALANPTLTLFRGATVLKTNDDWFRDPDAALIRDAAAKSGAFALGASSLDATMLLYLEPGAYTALVSASGTTNGTGFALVEIYEVGP